MSPLEGLAGEAGRIQHFRAVLNDALKKLVGKCFESNLQKRQMNAAATGTVVKRASKKTRTKIRKIGVPHRRL